MHDKKGLQVSRRLAESAIRAAESRRAAHQYAGELVCLLDATQNALSDAVQSTPDADTGVAYLRDTYAEVLARAGGLLLGFFRAEGAVPGGLQVPASQPVIAVQALWLLGRHSEGARIAAALDDARAAPLFQSSRLWRAYAAGLASISTGRSFSAPAQQFAGYERHLAVYLSLLEAYSRGADPGPALRAAADSFRARNRDRRLIGDGLFGDGEHPVSWDFQCEAIERFMAGVR